MAKIRKIAYSILFIYAMNFPASRLIIEMKSINDSEDSDDIHLFI
jgi:hypothetical protein